MKIFGIGLPKTGTTSLHAALLRLGFRSHHAPRNFRTKYFKGDFDFDEFEPWDALTNMFEHTFPTMDAKYPGSKFIHTTRDVEKWLPSLRANYEFLDERHDIERHAKITRIDAVHCTYYDEEILRHVHRFHSLAVQDYFRGREEDILHVDLTAGGGWKELCEFLGCPIPSKPFPHKNRKVDRR